MLDAFMKKHVPPRCSAIAVGVSGGPDSLCLTWVLSKWAQEHKVKLVAFTVDHGLRPESSTEAQQVVQWLKEWGIVCYKISLSLTKTSSQRTREARLAALISSCHRHGMQDLFLAHHQDDLLETVWMRQHHGSGPKGLAGISAVGLYQGIYVYRPFLSVEKQVLTDLLRHLGQPFVTDPSNTNPRYERTVARQEIQKLCSAQRKAFLQDIEFYMDQRCQTDQRIQKAVRQEQGEGYVAFSWEGMNTLCLQDQQWLLMHGLMSQSYCRHPCKQKMMASILQALTQAQCTTGAGCLVYRKHKKIYIFREWKRITAQACLHPYTFWDGRFLLSTPSPEVIVPWGLSKKESWVHTQAYASFPNLLPGVLATYYPICSAVPFFVKPERASS